MQYGRTHILNRDRNVEINLIEDVGDPVKDGRFRSEVGWIMCMHIRENVLRASPVCRAEQ